MSLLPVYAAVLTFLVSLGGCSEQVHQYMSEDFTFYKTEFNCSTDQKVLFEMMVMHIHPTSENCNAYIGRTAALDFWLDINQCINEGASNVEGCEMNREMESVVYQVDQRLILADERVTLPCGSKEEPEILQMTLHYTCPQSDEMPDFGEHHHAGGGILTIPQGFSTPPELPPTEPELTTILVTEEPTTITTQKTTTTPSTPTRPLTTKLVTLIKKTTMKLMDKTTRKPIPKSSSQLTSDQLAVIVAPSVLAGAAVVAIIAIIYFCCMKRGDPKNGDHQGVSLFSRRFSTASQASDVSLNNIQPISTKP